MQIKLNQFNLINMIKKLFAACLLTLPLSVTAVDYDVLEGTFFMATVSPGGVNTITGTGTEASVPGFPLVGKFSDGGFAADFVCSEHSNDANNINDCETASEILPPFYLGGPDPATASNTGFATFDFFGFPVFTYFAGTGIDGFAPPGFPSPLAAPHPFPVIDLVNLTADFGGFYASWSGTEFNQGSIDPLNIRILNNPIGSPNFFADIWTTNATIVDNNDGSYTVNWEALITGLPFNGKVGTWVMRICPSPCVLIPPAKAPTLEATYGGAVTRTLVQGGVGGATVTFDAGFDATGINFVWDGTDDSLDDAAGSGGVAPPSNTLDTLTISQALIDAAALGVHRVLVKVTDTNVTPNAVATGEVLLRVAAGAVPDTDNDGIPDSADSITDVTMLQSDSTTETEFVMTTSAGSLKLGTTAFCASNTSAEITIPNITAGGGIACAATTNAVDATGTVATGVGGYFDFEVHGLTRGQTVDVVIPLKAPIGVNAGYRKYKPFSGWLPFDQTTGDTVMSAAGTPGTCPSAASGEYVAGLVEGYNCLKLSITDGGPNDADGGADGIIKDPGAMSSNPDTDTSLLDLGGSLSWPVLAALATWIGLVRRKARH